MAGVLKKYTLLGLVPLEEQHFGSFQFVVILRCTVLFSSL